jgi:hypothetical protein
VSERPNHAVAGVAFIAACIIIAGLMYLGLRSGSKGSNTPSALEEGAGASTTNQAAELTGPPAVANVREISPVEQRDNDEVPTWPSPGDPDYYSSAPCYGEWSAQPGNPLGSFSIGFTDKRGENRTYRWRSDNPPSEQSGSFDAVIADRSFNFTYKGKDYNLSCEGSLATLSAFVDDNSNEQVKYELIRIR